MKKNPLTQGILTENSVGVGTVTHQMVSARARELAVINGHSAHDVSAVDWAQARRELTGQSEPDTDPKEIILESVTESERWDPLPGSTGRQAIESSSEEADDEGRSESEQLVEEGVKEAAHDQMLQSALTQRKNDES
jgi:hypothetical protein